MMLWIPILIPVNLDEAPKADWEIYDHERTQRVTHSLEGRVWLR